MVSRLRVVRFAGTGTREYHELAMCIPFEDNATVRVIYADREATCALQQLKTSLHVNVQTMISKAHVRHTVDRDRDALCEALRGEVADHTQVRHLTCLDRAPHHVAHTT